jgi:hypothetical protein
MRGYASRVISAGHVAPVVPRDALQAQAYGSKAAHGVIVILRNVACTGERYEVNRAHPAIISRRRFNDAQARIDQAGRAG